MENDRGRMPEMPEGLPLPLPSEIATVTRGPEGGVLQGTGPWTAVMSGSLSASVSTPRRAAGVASGAFGPPVIPV